MPRPPVCYEGEKARIAKHSGSVLQTDLASELAELAFASDRRTGNRFPPPLRSRPLAAEYFPLLVVQTIRLQTRRRRLDHYLFLPEIHKCTFCGRTRDPSPRVPAQALDEHGSPLRSPLVPISFSLSLTVFSAPQLFRASLFSVFVDFVLFVVNPSASAPCLEAIATSGPRSSAACIRNGGIFPKSQCSGNRFASGVQ